MKLAPALIAFLVISISSVRAAALAQRTGAYTVPIAGALALTIRSSVDVFKDGKVEIIANDRGQRVAPSHVGFVREELLVGHVAKNQAPMNLAVLSMCRFCPLIVVYSKVLPRMAARRF
ncbi:ATPase with role in protein import into the ER [Entophlyctis sp. JEL0112]|nr:ATPase with role in protein import into the ER [Entophlyctis sp. JEL0112]